MKYFINVNQLILAEHKNLDIKDAAILDYIYFYCNSQNVKIVKNRVCENNFCWTWINYNTLLKDMPLLRLKSVGTLTPRIDRLKKAGYIRTKRLGNQKLYFRTTQKIDELFIKMNRAVQENEQSCSFKRTNKDKKDKDKKINTTSDASVAGDSQDKEFNLTDEINKLLHDKQRHIQIIGLWIREKGLMPDNKKQLESIIKRNVRTAKLLIGYPGVQIKNTIDVLKSNNRLPKYTLETVLKYIDDVSAEKKSQGEKIVNYAYVTRKDGVRGVMPIYEGEEIPKGAELIN